MSTGAITSYIDVAQLVLYAFWFFFAGLIYYLLRENKREGYPLSSDRSDRAPRVTVQGFPRIPSPKTYRLADGREFVAPSDVVDDRGINARPVAPWPGAPLKPEGDPMEAGVGPGSYAPRADIADVMFDGQPRIVPMRSDPEFSIAPEDPDPRGMVVYGADGRGAGQVVDVWVDRSEGVIRYYEIALGDAAGRRVMLPNGFARVDRARATITVRSLMASQFARVPAIARPDGITLFEEERVMAYYGAGTLYAHPSRQEPLF